MEVDSTTATAPSPQTVPQSLKRTLQPDSSAETIDLMSDVSANTYSNLQNDESKNFHDARRIAKQELRELGNAMNPDGTVKISNRALKKAAHKQEKKKRKLEGRKQEHALMLEEARKVREKLQSFVENSKVSDNSMYRNIPRMADLEVYNCLGEAYLKTCDLLKNVDFDEKDIIENTKKSEASNFFAKLPPNERNSCEIVHSFMDRPAKYHEKYASQEVSLLFQIFRLNMDRKADLVIDVGAGNANLSLFIQLVFDVDVICVEMDSPRLELRAEEYLPEKLKARKPLERVESLIQNYTLPEKYKNVIILGKHLCGPGTDAGIEFIRKAKDRVLGCVFATCCCCKLVREVGSGFFSDLYFHDDGAELECVPVAPQDDFSKEVKMDEIEENSINNKVDPIYINANGPRTNEKNIYTNRDQKKNPSAASNLSTIIENTSNSADMSAQEKYDLFRKILPNIARMTSWRNTVNTDNNLIDDDMVKQSEFFESWIQGFRKKRLSEIFGPNKVEELLYCDDDVHSQQNRVIISGRNFEPATSSSNSSAKPEDHPTFKKASVEFMKLLETRYAALKAEGLMPLDLRPRGLVSTKFQYDGSGLTVMPDGGS